MEITPGLFRLLLKGTPKQNKNLDPEGVCILLGDDSWLEVLVHDGIISDGAGLQ